MRYDVSRIRALLEQRKPGHTLPQAFYRDPEFHEFDLDAIFGRRWLFAGLEIDLPKPTGYVTLKIGRSSVVLVRAADGQIRGFFNTCRHRGAEICQETQGRVGRLVCPYHQWTYGLDGQLLAAGGMPADFDKSSHGLKPIHLEVVAGTIFICLADSPPDFAPIKEGFEPLLAPHQLAEAKIAHEATIVEKGNWKLVMENARECYHCHARHPELMKCFPDIPKKKHRTDEPATTAFIEACEAKGLPTGPFIHEGFEANRFALRGGARSFTLDGQPAVKKLLGNVGDGNIGSLRFALDPNSFAHAVGDYAFLFWCWPKGPEETLVHMKWVVNKDAVEGADYDLARLTQLWQTTNDQDLWLVENNQRGVNSEGYQSGPYSPENERTLIQFTDWYVTQARRALS
ncbi:MAG: aromatic ring-hydroxylating dioxygenase subunit alpha [Alphaproteobacteria bacterium]|nr:aromatic ring-hydroxylating dioxygenase subunit alpha [Alphaproteobacteria bacterium]